VLSVTHERARFALYRINTDHGTVQPVAGGDPFDVLAVGDLNPDLLVYGDDLIPRFGQLERYASMFMTLGGSAGIFAAGAARLGLRTCLVACIGDDPLGSVALEMLASRGVDGGFVRRVAGERTGLTIHFLRPGDRAMLTERGAFAAVQAGDAIAHLAPAAASSPAAGAGAAPVSPAPRGTPAVRHVHIASLFLLPGLLAEGGALIDAAHAVGATVSVDTNDDPAGRFERPDWLTRADVLLPNEREVLALAGRDDLVAAARALAADGALVAVKRGAGGALAVDGDELCEVNTPARTAVDAVGAGDSFDAGFLAGRLAGRPLRESLLLACASGALSLRAPGGVDGQPMLSEAEQLAAELAG
jgi:sugar/nucleoside kinase (ribokinase family)